MTPARLRDLLALAAAKKARDLARLDQLNAATRALDAEIAAAFAAAAEDAAAEPTPLAVQAARLVWADGRIRAARRDKAALAGEIGAARAAATRSLGKHEVLERLTDRAVREAAARRAARDEGETPPTVEP